MSDEDLFQLISSQAQSYHELEAQSYRLFRILLTVGAIAIAFTQSEIFTQLLTLEIPSKPLELSGGGATASGFYETYGLVHLIIAGAVGLIGGAYLFDTMYWAARVLDAPPIMPVFSGSNRTSIALSITTSSIKKSDLAVWIESNQKSLKLAKGRLRNAYETIGVALLSLIFAGSCVAGVYLGSPNFLLLIDVLIVLFGVLALPLFLYELSGNITLDQSLRIQVRSLIDSWSEQNPTFVVAMMTGVIYPQISLLAGYFGLIYLTGFLI